MAWKKKEHPIVSDRKSVGQKCCTCIQKILPWTWGGFVTRHDWFIPDWEVWIKDIQGVTAAVGLRVRIRKHSSKYEKFPSEHAATVVCQRRHLTLSLTRKSSQIKTIEDVIREVSNVCKNYKMYFLKSHEWITYAPFYYSTSPPPLKGSFWWLPCSPAKTGIRTTIFRFFLSRAMSCLWHSEISWRQSFAFWLQTKTLRRRRTHTSTMVHFQLWVSRMWTSLNHFLFLEPPNTKIRFESGS